VVSLIDSFRRSTLRLWGISLELVDLGPFSEMDFSDPKRKLQFLNKLVMVAFLIAMCILMLTQPPCHHSPPSVFSVHEPGVTHVIVTGGAGYIGSHAAFRFLTYSYPVQLPKRW
jgi:UDP-arabinose 4-epimerase